MVERFTEQARRVVVLATEEARSRRHAAVDAEHLFVGILRDGAELAAKWLEHLRVSPETLWAQIERVMSERPVTATSDEPGFSPLLKAVLEVALEEQRRCRYPLQISTEHLLLGLLEDEQSTVNRILTAAGADLDRARLQVRLPFNTPIAADRVRFIATSKWRVLTVTQ